MENWYSESSPTEYRTDTLIIGAGQAGLAAAYYLQQAGVSFIIVDERAKVGDNWASRYDSLRLFSPAWASSLPGWAWPGDPLRYPTKDEAGEYLRTYAQRFQFEVHPGQRVVWLRRVGLSGYEATTQAGHRYVSRRVIVCTGGYDAPRTPAMAQQLAESVGQVHSRHYQRPSQLLGEGPVAVVGSGNSALQIAADIATTGRPVYLAFDERTPKAPNNTLTWLFLKATRLLRFSRHGLLGAHIYSRPEPVVSGDLKRVQRMPNVHEIGRALAATARTIQGKRGTTPDLDAVVWATGFGPDFRWIDLPVLNQDGHPEHQRGLSSLPGLAFLGLPWLDSRGSALMGGIRHDAQRVVNALIAS